MRDLALVLAASELLSGPGVVLYLEGSHFAPEVRAFLETRPEPKGRREVARGTIWPRSLTFHLPLDGELASRLRELTNRHASPEICDHLVIYSGERALLEAYDASGGPSLRLGRPLHQLRHAGDRSVFAAGSAASRP